MWCTYVLSHHFLTEPFLRATEKEIPRSVSHWSSNKMCGRVATRRLDILLQLSASHTICLSQRWLPVVYIRGKGVEQNSHSPSTDEKQTAYRQPDVYLLCRFFHHLVQLLSEVVELEPRTHTPHSPSCATSSFLAACSNSRPRCGSI